MANPSVNNANPFLLVKEIKDQYLRKNFQNLSDYFSQQNQLLDFAFFDRSFTEAQENVKIAHGLTYIPQDIICTQVTGAGRVTFNYGQFDKTNLDLSVSDACRVRFFAGAYRNNQTADQNPDDVWTMGSLPAASEDDGGALSFPYKQIDGTNGIGRGYQVALDDQNFMFNGAATSVATTPTLNTLGAVLPLAKDATGRFYTFSKFPSAGTSPTCNVSVQPGSQDYIQQSSVTSVALTHQYEKYTFFSNGTYWMVFQTTSFQNAISNAKNAPPASTWHNLTNNMLTLQPGMYIAIANATFAGNANYTGVNWGYFSANGTDALVFPPQSWDGLTTYMNPSSSPSVPPSTGGGVSFGIAIFVVTKPVDVYLVTFAAMTVPANASIQISWGALKIA